MFRSLRACPPAFVLFLLFANPLFAQAPPAATAPLKEVHVEGAKLLTEPQVIALSGLAPGNPVGRSDLQAAADKLVKTGLFSNVNYNFQTRADGVSLTFHIEEAPRIPAYFDNLPWFADSELQDAIRKKLPFFDGSLPVAGSTVDLAADAIKDLLSSHGLQLSVEHMVIANPLGDGDVQEIHIEGAALRISNIEFGDPALAASHAVQQHLPEIVGKPYSRMAIDTFLTEAIRPIYLQQGYLRARLGPAEVRLTGNPNQKLPSEIPVFVPIVPGAIYHWKDPQWTGNKLLSEFALNALLGLKSGDIANGMQIQAAWDRVREEYGRHGFLDAKLDPATTYDDQQHTVSYTVTVEEGTQYRFGKMVLTGISSTGERKLRSVWPIAEGDIFDKSKFEELLSKLETHQEQVFGDLPLHFDNVGHWLQTDPAKGTVDVLLDFK